MCENGFGLVLGGTVRLTYPACIRLETSTDRDGRCILSSSFNVVGGEALVKIFKYLFTASQIPSLQKYHLPEKMRPDLNHIFQRLLSLKDFLTTDERTPVSSVDTHSGL